jgi:ribosomal protein L37AE/L43A
MATASGAKPQPQSNSVTAKEQTFETMADDFQCVACGQYKIRRTDRESWYTCINCGYSFGMDPYPKQRLQARDVCAGWSISH